MGGIFMDRRTLRRAAHLGAGVFVAAVAAVGFDGAAHADTAGSSSGSSTSQIVGFNATAQGLGAQFGFYIPNIIPLPNVNLLEADVPFARTIINSGQTYDAIGAPYYPGDLLGNFGGLASEFFPPQAPNPGNWPFMARAQYPTAKTSPYQGDASFGGNPPGGTPISPTAVAGTAHANANGGSSSGTLANLVIGAGMAPGGADLLQVASVTANSAVNLGASTVTATAQSVVKAIQVVGMLDITGITSDASSSSDGTNGNPAGDLHIGQVTVQGQQAYIDGQGVHVVGNGTSGLGVPTPAQVQQNLNATLAQDGISIRLLDPQQTINGAEGIADSGGLQIKIDHNFSVPFVNTGALTGGAVQPCINTDQIIPNQNILGKICVPAGNYEAITSITLGSASVDVNASALTNDLTQLGGGDNGLGGGTTDLTGGLGLGDLGSGGSTSIGSIGGPGVTNPSTNASGGLGQLAHFPIKGVPAPVGWVAFGIILCVIFAYPMLLAARWQFLVGRR